MIRLILLSFLNYLSAVPILQPDYSQLDNKSYWKTWEMIPATGAWKTANRKILHNNQEFRIKGANLNGLESGCGAILGLWEKPLSFYLDFLKDNGFNSVRLPIPFEMMKESISTGNCVSSEPLFYNGMPSDDMIQIILDECHKRNLYVLPDLHTIGGVITAYPWTDRVSEDDVINGWVRFVKRFGSHPSVMGIEIKNEPHAAISLEEFFNHCGKVIYNILQYVPEYEGLFFVAAVQYKGSAWGGSYEDKKPLISFIGITHPNALCLVGVPNRIVLCPHQYFTDVRGMSASDENEDTWERTYGFIWQLQNHWNQSVIVPTEYGGYMLEKSIDRNMFEKWIKWFRHKGYDSGAYAWTTDGQFSGDTSGLLQGRDHTPDQYKIQFAQRLID